MRKALLSRYEVDNVPLFLKPLFYFYGYSAAFIFLAYFLIARATLRVEIRGDEILRVRPNYIFCFWHTFIVLYFSVFLRNRSHIWMQHASWFMKPAHVLLRFIGVKELALGSTGHSGQKAADRIFRYIRKGYSSVLLPDGPSGPPFKLNKGVLHIALQSHVPIVPMQFTASRYFELHTWDRKKWPYPFSSISIEFGNPIQVTSANFAAAFGELEKALGTKEF
ncbi:MAG: hypothetical protein JSV55_02080 [Deltaproteobacteria bacterium]|nr:MAG: hypothetical protein JSV55_02080 [Deltaproteobacteria bacterium]